MSITNEGLVGSYLGRYKIEELVGRGGMAEVYRATQINLDRFVAIKIMHRFLSDDRDFLSRFEREARVMAKIRHPNIVHVHDYEVHDDYYYIVMDYLPGGTLKNLLDRLSVEGGVIDLALASKVTLEIGEALGYAHNIGMVHRDIKPANIMFDEKGIAVLTDFGIARMVGGTTHTTTGSMIGTPAYMSPEQGLGESGDERSDIYSLGVLAFHLFTGRLPFEGDTPLSVVLKHINENPPLLSSINPDIPPILEKIVLKAMDKNPDNRWNSVLEMNQEIRKALKQISKQDDDDDFGVPAGTQDYPTPVPSLTVPNSENDSIANRVGRTPVTHNFMDNSTTILGEAAFQENAVEFTMPEPNSEQPTFNPPPEPQNVPQPEMRAVEEQNLLPDLDAAPLFAPSPLPERRGHDRMGSAPGANSPAQPNAGHQPSVEFPTLDVYKEIEAERNQHQMPQNVAPVITEEDAAAEKEYSSEMSSFMKGFDKKADRAVKFKPTENPLVKKARRRRTFKGVNSAIKGILVAFFVVAGIIFGILFVTRFTPTFDIQGTVDDLLDNPSIEEVDLGEITAENAIVLSPFTRASIGDTGLVLSVSNRSSIPARWQGSLEYALLEDEGATEEDGLVPIEDRWKPVDGKRVAFDGNGEIAWEVDGTFPADATFRWVLHPSEGSNEILGMSEEFTLPAESGEILEISVNS